MIFWIGCVCLAALAGLVAAVRSIRYQPVLAARHTAGWVYFLAPVKDDYDSDGPDKLVKIGMTHRDPAVDRLPEIETMSPEPLRVIWSYYTPNARLVEAQVHRELAQFRHHGEWFDRDAALAYISHIKGES